MKTDDGEETLEIKLKKIAG